MISSFKTFLELTKCISFNQRSDQGSVTKVGFRLPSVARKRNRGRFPVMSVIVLAPYFVNLNIDRVNPKTVIFTKTVKAVIFEILYTYQIFPFYERFLVKYFFKF